MNGLTEDSIEGVKEVCYKNPKKCQVKKILNKLNDLDYKVNNFSIQKAEEAMRKSTFLTTDPMAINNINEYISMGKRCNFIFDTDDNSIES